MHQGQQQVLFPITDTASPISLPGVHCHIDYFPVERVILARGSLKTPEREAFVQRICALYPQTPVEEQLDTPHNRVGGEEEDPARRFAQGRRTLVFTAPSPDRVVRANQWPNVIFPYRQSFSVYGFCPYGCRYCYMAGSPGVWFSPTVKIYVNLPEILAEIDRKAREIAQEATFCLGKFEDGLALDSLTSYSRVVVPFFARHPSARLFVQTKAASVDHLLDLWHAGRTTLSWTLTPSAIAARFEPGAPPVAERIDAMQRCSQSGYPVQANLTPVIPEGGWEDAYLELVREVVARVPLRKLIVGGIRLDARSLGLLEKGLGRDNAISEHLVRQPYVDDCRSFYKPGLLGKFYERLAHEVRRIRPCTSRLDTCHKRPHLLIEFPAEAGAESHGRTMALEFSHQHASNSVE